MGQDVLIYTRPGAMFSDQVAGMLAEAGVAYRWVEAVQREDQDAVLLYFQTLGFPFVTVNGALLGGFPEVIQLHAAGHLPESVRAPREPPKTPLPSNVAQLMASARGTLPRRTTSARLPAAGREPPAQRAASTTPTPAPGTGPHEPVAIVRAPVPALAPLLRRRTSPTSDALAPNDLARQPAEIEDSSVRVRPISAAEALANAEHNPLVRRSSGTMPTTPTPGSIREPLTNLQAAGMAPGKAPARGSPAGAALPRRATTVPDGSDLPADDDAKKKT